MRLTACGIQQLGMHNKDEKNLDNSSKNISRYCHSSIDSSDTAQGISKATTNRSSSSNGQIYVSHTQHRCQSDQIHDIVATAVLLPVCKDMLANALGATAGQHADEQQGDCAAV